MPLVEPAAKAPDFSLADQHGERHALADASGRHLVLYFYPKDDTSGCTKEACAFRDLMPRFESVDAEIWGVSPDDEASHASFAEKYDLNFPLLADTQRDPDDNPVVCNSYGVWGERSMYGRTFMGVTRTTYLIGPDGRVLRRWDNVKVPNHADEVLEALRQAR